MMNYTLPALTSQTSLFGLFDDFVNNKQLTNQILLLFKLYIYKSRNKHKLKINNDLANKNGKNICFQ